MKFLKLRCTSPAARFARNVAVPLPQRAFENQKAFE